MAATIKRRRFQAPITSFFASRSTQSGDPSTSPQEPLSSPTLPEAIQSSLLTVGMRIRKSVPEGYKTHKITYPSSLQARSGYFLDSGVQEHESAKITNRGNHTELAPFCGLHKIGGMAVQPMPVSYRSNAYERGAEEMEEPGLWSVPSSQESIDSNPSALPSNKRGFTFDLDEDDDDNDEVGVDGTSAVSQQQPPYPFSHARLPISNFNSNPTVSLIDQSLRAQANSTTFHRPFAIPRSRLPSNDNNRTLKTKARALAGQGQENIGLSMMSNLPVAGKYVNAVSSATSATFPLTATFDFEDADFLEAREEADEMMDG